MHIEIMTGKRKSFSLSEKRRLLEASDKLPKTSRRDAAEKLGVPQAADRKAPVDENALVRWIDKARSRDVMPPK